MTEREFAVAVVSRLREAGYQALWAGGCVRDELLDLEPGDYDVATDARPEEVQQLFRRTVAVGASFGVVEVLGPRENPELHVEVATFRSDGAYLDGRHPESVQFSSPEQDAQRRDFTINGLFFDPLESQLIDFVNGQADLEARILRAIGDPAQRFAEDKLRIMRGVRLAARFELSIDTLTLDAMRAMADQITVVSAERIADELKKMLALPQRVRAMKLLMDLGIADIILPELAALRDWPASGEGEAGCDAWMHVLRALGHLEEPVSFPLAFACLLHRLENQANVTEPTTTRKRDGRQGYTPVGLICRRLKLSVAERERVDWLVTNQRALLDAPNLSRSKLKRILAAPGILELLALHDADARAEGSPTDHVEFCRQLLDRWSRAEIDPPVLATGHDLEALGLSPGPEFKPLLDTVRDAQLNGILETREDALAFLKWYLELKATGPSSSEGSVERWRETGV
jgi:poly(A) polymerase